MNVGSVPPALYAGFNPTEFPGIVFSKFCAEENVTSKGAIIKGEGIKLSIPEGAIRPGDEVPIALQGCIGGPFVFPDGIVPVSPVYRIAPPCVFHQEVILTIEHFAELQSHEDCEEMVFITCPTKPKIKKRKGEPYWKFRISSAHLDCTPRGQHGDIRLTHFCLGALGRKLGRGNYKSGVK